MIKMRIDPGRPRTIVEEFFDSVLEKLPREYETKITHRPDYPEPRERLYSPEDLDGGENGEPVDPNEYLFPLDEDWWSEEIWGLPWPIINDYYYHPIGRIVEETREYGGPLEEGVETGGIDILAYYKSYHFLSKRPFSGRWGIFYLAAGVGKVVRDLSHVRDGRPRSLFALALNFLRVHERYHYRFDLYTGSLENLLRRPLYEPHLKALGPYQIHSAEEALANKAVWEWAQRPEIDLGEWAHAWLKNTPGAYRRFDEPRAELEAELAANLLDLDFRKKARRHNLAGWLGLVPQAFLRDTLCPEYVVRMSPALRRRLKPPSSKT